MAQNINATTSFMTELFSDLDKIVPSRGFMGLYGRDNSKTVFVENARQILIDIIRGDKKIAELLPRVPGQGETNIGSNLKSTNAQVFKNVARDFGIIQTRGNVSFDETLDRVAGEIPINSGFGGQERARVKFAEIVKSNFLRIFGRMEKQAADTAQTGITTFDDGSTYNFARTAGNTIVPAILWSATTTAVPLNDIDDACDAIQENGKTEGAVCVMGKLAFNAFLNTDQITNTANNRRLNFIQAGDKVGLPGLPSDMQYLVTNGFKYMAHVTTETGRDIYIFTYNEKYQNSGGTWVSYMAEKDVLILDHKARRDRYFGPRIRFALAGDPDEIMMNNYLGISNLQNQAINMIPSGIVDARMFHHDGFLSKNKTSIEIESYTGPIYAPTHVDATALLDGVIA